LTNFSNFLENIEISKKIQIFFQILDITKLEGGGRKKKKKKDQGGGGFWGGIWGVKGSKF